MNDKKQISGKKKKIKRAVAIMAGVIILLLILSVYRSKYALCVTKEQISVETISDLRILQLSDLHNSVFGNDNERLIEKVKEQSPDLILFTGDVINSGEEDTSVGEKLIEKLTEIAPVYLSLGNHEVEYMEIYGTDLIQRFKHAGATVLEKKYQDIDIKGQKIRLGGIYSYCVPEAYLTEEGLRSEEYVFLRNFQSTDRYKILMCHMPLCWIVNQGLEAWKVDCVFAGHVHGGQIIIPGVGGLYAPDFGFFPGKLQGLYASKDKNRWLVLSRGLGSTEKIPRVNNVPEIVTVDFR